MDATPLASRRAAVDVLMACLDKGQPLDDALAGHRGFTALDPRDRAFVRLLLATTVRHLGEIEGVLSGLITKPLDGANAVGRQVLRLGAAQLMFLGTPPHAAVDTSVRLVEDAGLHHLKGLINAVLRRISRDGDALLVDRDPTRLNTPRWLWESWIHAYGEDTTRAIASAHLHEAPLDLTVRRDADFWAGQLEAEKLPTGTLRRKGGGHIAELPGFAEGTWWVQDAAAALPVRLLGDVTDKRVADLCAAPGGKTMQLCAAGAQVTAVDISARRMTRLGENLARAGLSANLVTADASKWTPEEKFDAILLDAPCSGTGTLRRHPDIAWLKDEEDVARLTVTQDRLLVRALDMLKPGGTLVYAVCSLQEDEGVERINGILVRNPHVKRVRVTPAELPGLEDAITPRGDVRTYPFMWADRGGLDGFYMARLTTN
ncbi:transcription antitermination factor NusB [Reyranella sp.]|jgi:16S rRNA (cytosine967-C5)-methyltransferase|uniref:RsmB/NOP family class I SAM-dependent RNA methyltransferase n=1 Tax=Reyranella sp. TaxID=1929291 RepID=UPI000BCB4391|nr:transcription antitermination factor NusB [Reyranella sp.]OYY41015.1 MAG: MFS transporter [Rhodospirillales bacterium 35-66-84]OYZ95986.1 MAG: MFS transporter [Rhodospirillales bacterium 24-66-33]OZB25867.1 MAG: MFS transporter [Rhodospirillales bacterium 39-66-50]HQS14798.1 transcription antitermination factor NusB [Reyranella sp.]HQT14185.1 transcription antitermination factor NusB [Reyranella sp.]